ncbi:nucleoside hydrolase [Bacillus sp. S/N-304-OC-R1]|uniref:nucleoside hydrolase n=1 Tax=Bacillus sp. S/N-304-OC-R1 TaxID=2758034 RepID=UPI001C8EB09A|nr:nucleoside hydrolase [Bacillus sp. S/N-304-OC-R1]MBY0122714.1 nucleoside hydrolase [Bacillus sp. S/N-304-OC-R1]
MRMKNILLFSDFGIDDIVATLFAYLCPEINIVGIVADYGNVSRKSAIRNAAYLEEVTGIKNIPIFGGAELPLTGEMPKYVPEVHGIEGLGPIVPNLQVDENLFENFNEVNSLIEKYKDNITIVSIGRLSSLAAAFILSPRLMEKVKDYYIMGGAFNVPGNVTPAAEANFYGDPYAAKILINNAHKRIHLFPLDVTMSATITPSIINSLHQYYEATKNKIGLLVKPMVDYYYSSYKKSNPGISGSPLHDVFTLWALLDRSDIQYREVPIQIVVDNGIAFGKSIGDFRKNPDLRSKDYKVHKVAVQFNYKTFVKDFFEIMRTPESNILEK